MVHITNIYWPKIRTQKRNNGSLLTEIWMTYNGILDVIEMESISLLHWWMIHSYGYDGLYTVSINSIPLSISILILVAISNHCNYNSFDHFDICTKQPNLPSQITHKYLCKIQSAILVIRSNLSQNTNFGAFVNTTMSIQARETNATVPHRCIPVCPHCQCVTPSANRYQNIQCIGYNLKIHKLFTQTPHSKLSPKAICSNTCECTPPYSFKDHHYFRISPCQFEDWICWMMVLMHIINFLYWFHYWPKLRV